VTAGLVGAVEVDVDVDVDVEEGELVEVPPETLPVP
jgi:hypothetical protein